MHRPQAASRASRPSKRVRELIRRGAQLALSAPDEWVAEIGRAAMSSRGMKAVADDPVLAAALRRLNLTSVAHWAASNVRDPGAPVVPLVGAEPLELTKELARRGWDRTTLDAYRAAEDAALERWMSLAFDLTRDPAELKELITVTARSIHAFFRATIDAIGRELQVERDSGKRGTHPELREMVERVVEGSAIDPGLASRELGYGFEGQHRAAVVWTDENDPDGQALDLAARALGAAAGARPLVIIAGAATRWVWVHERAALDHAPLLAATGAGRSARLALGSAGAGIEGFRRSHLDALRAQRTVARLGSIERVVSFDDLRLPLLVSHDRAAAEEFIHHTLGELAEASAELRSSVLGFLREGCNASLAATRLRTHRNTLVRRLARADELLPRPLAAQRIDVAVALELARWRGAAPTQKRASKRRAG